jgi:hypothetical protein
MKFVLMVIENEMSKHAVRENRTEHRRQLERWMAEQAKTGRLRGGEAFDTEKAPVTIRRERDGSHVVAEGPFALGNETNGGFIVVEVADRQEAIAVAKSWPTGETIEIWHVWTAKAGA